MVTYGRCQNGSWQIGREYAILAKVGVIHTPEYLIPPQLSGANSLPVAC
jgi:hypothetical protein